MAEHRAVVGLTTEPVPVLCGYRINKSDEHTGAVMVHAYCKSDIREAFDFEMRMRLAAREFGILPVHSIWEMTWFLPKGVLLY